MENILFSQFSAAIRAVNVENINTATMIPQEFLLGSDGNLASVYTPFDYVNDKAKIVIVGITPGFSQWKNAIREAKQQLLSGASEERARIAAKKTGAFSGAMRPNLVALLDSIGIHQWLGIPECETLFSTNAHLVQTTSLLRHAIFVDGKNYSGTPNTIRTTFLRKQMLDHFAKEATQLSNPVYIPLGPKVSEGLAWLAEQGVISQERILDGLPHPSGANAERIAYFLGRKDKASLSVKTNPDQLDAMRNSLLVKMNLLA